MYFLVKPNAVHHNGIRVNVVFEVRDVNTII